MLSRIAESLYWIGRFVERAEDTARITDVNYHHTLEMGGSEEAEARRCRHWEALITIVGDAPRFFAAHQEANEQTVPPYLTFATDNPNSIVSCVAQARENARAMRHQIVSEMWEVLNRFHLDLQRRAVGGEAPVGAQNAHLFYRSVVEFSHLFQGITDSTMPREEGWYFLQAGKFLERAEKTARALDVKYHLLVADAAPGAPVAGPGFTAAAAGLAPTDGVPGDWHQWLAVLRSLSAYEAYHKLYRSAVRPRAVIEMLTLSPVFPRSIRFAIAEVDAALARIAAQGGAEGCVLNAEEWGATPQYPGLNTQHAALGPRHEAERATGRLHSALAYQRVEEVFATGLHAYLVDLQRQCYQIGEHIQEQYFAHRPLRAEEVVA
ncbi:MAG: alpha-E domain-containing protein [Chloroflexota bacterium]|nr:alpha-E domain-containing protein [Chloroflexota bacterium]